MTQHPLVSVLVIITFVACSGDAGRGSDTTVRDSAGIRIVEHADGARERLPGWTLSTEPRLDIGIMDGPEEYQLFRVWGARVLRNGDIVVLNSGTAELRIYDATGTFLRALGGSGEGPGEFAVPWGMWELPGDTLMVWDFTLRRVSLFTQGHFVRGSRPDREVLNVQPLGALADGHLLLKQQVITIPDVGFQMSEQNVFAFTMDGAFVDTLGTYQGQLWGKLGASGRIGGPLFDPQTQLAAGDSAYWVGTARDHELTRYDATGAPRLVVRWVGDRATVPRAAVSQSNECGLAADDNENQRRRTRLIQEARPPAEYLPVYDSLVVDRTSALWVRLFGFTWTADAEWIVFGADGIAVGRLTAPRGFQFFDIGEDYVLGLEKDELDVEHVRMYDIIRPER